MKHFLKIYSKKRPIHEELHRILQSTKEKIVILDESAHIRYYNQSFAKLFSHTKNMTNSHYLDIISIPAFSSFVSDLLSSKEQHLSKEINLHSRIFQLSASIIKSPKMFVIIFLDITESKTLEQIKRDFIANASHELRTPLTAIKGYLELMKDDDNNSKMYLEVVSRNTDRIINIVNDLLKISHLEEPNITLALEECNINKVISDVIVLFENKLKDKNLKISMSLTHSSTIISADKLRMEEVFINLIDNAIKYSEQGTIDIRTIKFGNKIEVRIKDTGIGIPSAHLSRIFERFFVVDSTRSKKSGGTGLGLSIVKHIIQQHKGSIKVYSEQGKGTEFVVRLTV